mmetsp:Transcript_7339/g.11166  ORF Transcript_7339/g.11166 Transcript_7339/m.11166 type:complete len:215 (+) Transcript_7339:98-742(+)
MQQHHRVLFLPLFPSSIIIYYQEEFTVNMQKYSGINDDGTLKKFSTPIASLPASVAASNGDVKTLGRLSDDEILGIDEHGNTPLIWAANAGQRNTLDFILNIISNKDDKSSHLNLRGYLGNTAISRAAQGGHVECAAALMSQENIDPNICNEKMQFPLHFAAYKKHPDVVQILLNSGKCDTFVKDRKGRTPDEDTREEEIKEMIVKYRKDSGIN